jgi:hypothetical protein
MDGIIFWSNCTNTKIHRNTIHDWFNLGSGSNGIKVSTDNSTTITEIFNNAIYAIKCYGANPGVSNNLAYDIFIRRGSNIRMWHNSLYLSGPFLDGTGYFSPSSACIGVYEAASFNLDLRDNIMRNAMTNPSNPPVGTSYGRAYGVMFAGNQSTFNNLDYNDYYIDGYNGAIAQRWITGFGFGDEFNTLEQWQTYTGMESHSLAINPQFVSDTVPIDLHPANLALNSTGGPKILDDDRVGADRYTPPDMGAYEWSRVITLYHTLAATDVTETGATLNGDLNTNGEVVAGYFDYGLTSSYGYQVALVPATIRTNGTLQQVSAGITGLQPGTLYHFRFRGIPTTSGQATLYGDDMTFTTSGSAVPANITLNTTVSDTQCFNATQTITVAGSPNTFIVASSGHVDMIAGVNIGMLPGTKVELGGYLHAIISTQYCTTNDGAMMAAAMAGEHGNDPGTGSPLFKVYPNPSLGAFTLELKGGDLQGSATIEIFDMCGGLILKRKYEGEGKYELSLSDRPAGIYLVRLVAGQKNEIVRVVRL